MSVPASTLPTVKAWLLTRLQTVLTASSGKSLLVDYDRSGPTEEDDMVTVGTGRRTVGTFTMVGGMQTAFALEEAYELSVTVSVFRPEGFQVAEERAWALVAAVENVVRTDLFGGIIAAGTAVATLGGNVYHVSVEDHTSDGDWSPDYDGALVTIPYVITVRATI